MTPPVPTDRRTWEGELATYWFEDHILVSRSTPVQRTVEGIRANVALVQEITGNQPVPLLIYLSKSPVPDRATQRFSTTQLPLIYSAMAMVSAPGLARFIMNLLFALKPPPIPMKSFTNAADAKRWLLTLNPPHTS
jgi:hypothetical protein